MPSLLFGYADGQGQHVRHPMTGIRSYRSKTRTAPTCGARYSHRCVIGSLQQETQPRWRVGAEVTALEAQHWLTWVR